MFPVIKASIVAVATAGLLVPGLPASAARQDCSRANFSQRRQEICQFGFIPGVGRFAVIGGTYSTSNAIAEYDALVNGKRQRWWANCRTSEIGRVNQAAIRQNSGSQNVNAFFCTGANSSPVKQESRQFGFIPGVGDFAVIRETYSTSNAIAEYDALVNGKRQRWWANCRTSEIGRVNQAAIRQNSGSQNVNAFICTGG